MVVLEKRGSAEAPERDGHVGLGIWANALRCLAQAGIQLPEGNYMRDSAYLGVDGTILAKPGTMLQDGHLLFLRSVSRLGVGVRRPLAHQIADHTRSLLCSR